MRYVDVDAFLEKMKKTNRYFDVKFDIENFPTADVVPKSEVERLEHILDCYALQYGTVTNQREVIDKAKSEAAREIFEEIEYAMGSNYSADSDSDYPMPHYYEDLREDIAELKKKYTEGEK